MAARILSTWSALRSIWTLERRLKSCLTGSSFGIIPLNAGRVSFTFTHTARADVTLHHGFICHMYINDYPRAQHRLSPSDSLSSSSQRYLLTANKPTQPGEDLLLSGWSATPSCLPFPPIVHKTYVFILFLSYHIITTSHNVIPPTGKSCAREREREHFCIMYFWETLKKRAGEAGCVCFSIFQHGVGEKISQIPPRRSS